MVIFLYKRYQKLGKKFTYEIKFSASEAHGAT